MRRKGFTLIEILVVVAIIAVLIGVLIPSLRVVSQRAKAVGCQANLRQWGIVMEAYVDNNNGRFFEGMLDGSWDDWVEILEPYYGNKGGMTCCPTATKTAEQGGTGIFTAWADEEGDYGSYGMSAWICNAKPGAVFGDDLYWRSPAAKGAENVPVFLDCLSVAGWPDHTSVPADFNGQHPQGVDLSQQMKGFCIERHRNGVSNCLFMDWSVRAVGLKELWKLKWHPKFDTSGPWTKNHVPAPNWPEWMKSMRDY